MTDTDKIVAAILAGFQCRKVGMGTADGHVKRYREMVATLMQYESEPLPQGKAKVGVAADDA